MPSKEHLKGILFGNKINMIVAVVIWCIYLSTFLLTQTLYDTYVEYVIADKASINNTLVARSPNIIYPVENWGDGTLFRWNSGQVLLKILPVRYQYMMVSSAIMAYDDKDFVVNITYSNPQYVHVDGIKSGFRTYHLIFLPTPQNWSLGNKYSFSITPKKNNSIPIVNDRKLALAISYINIKSVSNDLQLALFEVVFSILCILLMYFMSYLSKIDNIFLSRLLIPAVVFHICAYHAFLGLERYLLYLIISLAIIFFRQFAKLYQHTCLIFRYILGRIKHIFDKNHIPFGALFLVIWTILITNLRSIRFPNDYAEVYWLIDYDFGFTKRGLIGSLSKTFGQLFGIQITPDFIIIFSSISLLLMYIVVLYLLSRGLQSSVRVDAVIIGLIFATSPFVLMNAHVFGYFDSILYFLCIVAVIFVLRGRYNLASLVSTLAVLVHEAYVFIGFPLVLFALIVHTEKTQNRSRLVFQFTAITMPLVFVLASMFILLQYNTADMLIFRSQLAQHLDSFGFVESQSRPVAYFQTISFVAYFSEQYVLFSERLFNYSILSVISPTLIAMILYIYKVYRIPVLSTLSFLLFGVICAPLLLHLVAWDTARISTFTIGSTFIAWWILSETRKHRLEFDWFTLIAIFVIIYNTLGIVSCSVFSCTMSAEQERFSIPLRLLLYSPTLAFVIACIAHTNRIRLLIHWVIGKQS